MSWHASVLREEVMDGLDVHDGNVILDATAGDGGHMSALCEKYGSRITLIGLDADGDQIARAKERLASAETDCNTVFIERNFRFIESALHGHGYEQVNRVLFDLGWSARQINGAGRGFSLRLDEPLVMTYNRKPDDSVVTANEILNSWDESTLVTLLKGYGEERFAKRIAAAIVKQREVKPIERTGDLVDVVMSATPTWYHHRRLHPATRTFQAIRIAVNDEIQALEEGLAGALRVLMPQGRLGVISFHSLEDRIVKRRFREWKDAGYGTIITTKPITPTPVEREENPRSRSAKLRFFQKI